MTQTNQSKLDATALAVTVPDDVDPLYSSDSSDSSLKDEVVFLKKNRTPDFVTMVDTGEVDLNKLSYKRVKPIYDLLVPYLAKDPFRQQVFVNFSRVFNTFVPTRSGVLVRSAFLQVLVDLQEVGKDAVPLVALFSSKLFIRPYFTALYVEALFTALTSNPVFCVYRKLSPYVYPSELKFVLECLSSLRNLPLNVTPVVVKSRTDYIQLLSLNMIVRQLSRIVKAWIGRSTMEHEYRGQCQAMLHGSFIYDLFSALDETGPIDLNIGPLAHVSSTSGFTKMLEALMLTSSANGIVSENQAFNIFSDLTTSLSQVPEIVGSVGDAAAGGARAVEKMNKMLDAAQNQFDAAAVTMNDVAETTQQVKPLIERITNLLEPYLKMLEGVADTFNSVGTAVKWLWKMGTENAYVLLPLVSVFLAVLLRGYVPVTVARTILMVLGLIGLTIYGGVASGYFDTLMRYLTTYWLERSGSEFLANDEGVDTASEGDRRNMASIVDDEQIFVDFDQPFVDQGAEDVIPLLASLYCGLGVDVSKKSEIMASLKAIPSVTKGAEIFYNSILRFVLFLSKNVSAYFGMDDVCAEAVNSQYSDWIKAADVFISADKSATVDTTEKGEMELQSVIDSGVVLAQTFQDLDQKVLGSLMHKAILSLQNVMAKLKATRVTEPRNRPEPICVVLAGLPGQGKTIAARMIAHSLIRYELREYPIQLAEFEANRSRFMFTMGSEKWQEGYNPRAIVVLHEEMPSIIETTPEESQLIGLLDEINDTSKPLPMAQAELKGKVFYNHRYSIITTNTDHFRAQFLRSQSAINRRLHVVVRVNTKGGIRASDLAVDLDENLVELTLCHVRDDGSNVIEETSTVISLTALTHYLAALSIFRENKRLQNGRDLDQISVRMMKDFQENLFFEAMDMFHSEFNRKPSTPQLFEYISNNIPTFEEMGYDIKKLKYFTKNVKGKEKVSHNQSNDIPLLYDTIKENPIKFLHNEIVRQEPRINRKVFSFLGRQFEFYLRSYDYLRNNVAGAKMDFGLEVGTELNCKEWEYKISTVIFTNYLSAFEGFLVRVRLEETLALMVSFGKYRLRGFPVPMLEVGLSHSTKVGVPNNRNHNFVESISTASITDPISTAARHVIRFLNRIGFDLVNGLSLSDAASWYYSDVDFISFCLSKGYEVGSDVGLHIRAFFDTAQECRRKVIRGECTYVEAAKELAKVTKLHIQSDFSERLEEIRSYYRHCVNKLYLAAQDAYAWLRKHGRAVCVALAVSSSLLTVTALVGSNSLSFLSSVNQESDHKNGKWRKSANRSKTTRWTVNKSGSEKQDSVHWLETVVPKVTNNMYEVVTPGGSIMGMLTFVQDRRALFPHHYLTTITDILGEVPDDVIFLRIRKVGSDKLIEIRACEMKMICDWTGDKDLVLMEFTTGAVPLHADIRKHFVNPITQERNNLSGKFRITFVNPKRFHSTNGVAVEMSDGIIEADAMIAAKVPIANGETRLMCISYNIPTKKGECGSLIFVGDKIAGVHAHGNGTMGQCPQINIVMLHDAYENPQDSTVADVSAFEPFEYDTSKLAHPQGYDLDVHVGDYIAPCSPPSSTFVKKDYVRWNPSGPIQPTVIPVNAEPANFPYARSKYMKVVEEIDDEIFELAAVFLGTHYMNLPNDNPVKRILTPIEAVVGVPGLIEAMEHNSSPGFPENSMSGGKKLIYTVDQDGNFFPGPRWNIKKENCDMAVKLCCLDNVPAFVFADSLKYELRKPSKVNSPRMVMGTSFEHNLLSKSFFGGFFAHLTATSMVGDTMMGVDPHSPSWDYMEKRFRSFGGKERNMTGDYSSYDSSVSSRTVRKLASIVNRWYGDSDESPNGLVRLNLAEACVVGVHNYGPVFELWTSGFASGSLMTAPFNGMRNTFLEIYSCMVTAKLLGRDYLAIGRDFFKNVYIKTMGDDKRVAVKPEYAFHNNVTHAKVVGEHFKMVYTNAAKSLDVVPFDDPDDLVLIKRKSVYVEDLGLYVGALDTEVILNMVCWTRSGDPVTIMQHRVDNARKELCFHPAEVWDRLHPLLLEQAGNHYQCDNLTQKQLRAQVMSNWEYM
jgi:hypothetical protein